MLLLFLYYRLHFAGQYVGQSYITQEREQKAVPAQITAYRYEMMGIVCPKYAEENVLIDYGIIEEEEA